MGVVRAYLAVYNCVLFAGWSQILYSAVLALHTKGPPAVYDAVEKPLQIWQTAALLEIFNSLVGITRSPVTATLPQIASRIFVTWGVLYSFPQVRDHWLVTSLILSWGITEVIRYSFFALKEIFGSAPRFLLWLRYTTFYILYPTGISSEAGLIFVALKYMKETGLYNLPMPNKLNFAFDYYYASILIIFAYLPGSPGMYSHMIRQRKKALAVKPKET